METNQWRIVLRHESATVARSDAARRVTERAMRMLETVVIVPIPGDPDPDRLANSNRIRAEIDAKRMAMNAANSSAALRRLGNNGKYFRPAPRLSDVKVSGKAVRSLVDEGELEWVNEAHSAAKVAEGADMAYAPTIQQQIETVKRAAEEAVSESDRAALLAVVVRLEGGSAIPTVRELSFIAANTGKGATRARLEAWGLPWPPPRGWVNKLLAEAREREQGLVDPVAE